MCVGFPTAGVGRRAAVEAVLPPRLHGDRRPTAPRCRRRSRATGRCERRERDSVTAMLAPPTPIGVGPGYHPRPAAHAACAHAPLVAGDRVHLELFADGRVVIVPAAVGVRGARLTLGRVRAARCRARIWTLDPTGVVQFEGRARLGDVFDVWGPVASRTGCSRSPARCAST